MCYRLTVYGLQLPVSKKGITSYLIDINWKVIACQRVPFLDYRKPATVNCKLNKQVGNDSYFIQNINKLYQVRKLSYILSNQFRGFGNHYRIMIELK